MSLRLFGSGRTECINFFGLVGMVANELGGGEAWASRMQFARTENMKRLACFAASLMLRRGIFHTIVAWN